MRASCDIRGGDAGCGAEDDDTSRGSRGRAGLVVAERGRGLCRALARKRRADGARGAAVCVSQAERGDLEATRWNLLAWEDPRYPQWAELFWADVAMVEARAAEPGEHGWPHLLRRAGATFTGLRLLDGALVLKVSGGRETGQFRVLDGAAFDPALSGLEVATRRGVGARRGWRRVESLEGIVFGR